MTNLLDIKPRIDINYKINLVQSFIIICILKKLKGICTYMKKYLKCFLKVILEIIFLTFILNLFFYFNVINNTIYSHLELIFLFLILYFNSLKLSYTRTNLNILEGIKLGTFFVLLFVIINIIFEHKFSINLLIYYLLIFLVPVLSSMRKKVKK